MSELALSIVLSKFLLVAQVPAPKPKLERYIFIHDISWIEIPKDKKRSEQREILQSLEFGWEPPVLPRSHK